MQSSKHIDNEIELSDLSLSLYPKNELWIEIIRLLLLTDLLACCHQTSNLGFYLVMAKEVNIRIGFPSDVSSMAVSFFISAIALTVLPTNSFLLMYNIGFEIQVEICTDIRTVFENSNVFIGGTERKAAYDHGLPSNSLLYSTYYYILDGLTRTCNSTSCTIEHLEAIFD